MQKPTRAWLPVLREAPLALGVGVGVALILRPGPGWFYPEGVDWEQYIQGAMALFHPSPGLALPPWRQPLHAYLVGTLGADMGYVPAAQLLAMGCAVVLVCASGLLARALAGPWAGGLAALVAVSLGSVAMAARLVTPYPLLAACFGLALALGAACSRWPRWPLALGAGLFAAAAWSADLKGSLAIPLAALLVLLGVPRAPTWRLRIALVLALAVGLAGPLALHRTLARHLDLHPLPLAEQVRSQRHQNIDQLDNAQLFSEAVRRECAGAPDDLSAGALVGPCGRALLAQNLDFLGVHRAIPSVPSAFLLPFCLLPAAWAGRRGRLVSSTAAIAALAAPLLAGLVGMMWISHGVRYVLHLAVPFAALVPVAGARLAELPGQRWPRFARWGVPAGALLAAAWILVIWPRPDLARVTRMQGPNAPEDVPWSPDQPDPRGRLAAWLTARLGPDDTLVDCAAASLDILVLPRSLATIQPLPHENVRCSALIKSPPVSGGAVWILLRHLPDDQGRRFVLPPNLPASYGWEEVWSIPSRPYRTPWPECCDELRLWRHEGGAQGSSG
ncbi:MAG: hypothetical protein ABIO70_26735 [Pseudomonadota bacterium]